METLLTLITPGSIKLPCKFSWRVITSWIVSGWVLGFIIAIFSFPNIDSSAQISEILTQLFVFLPFVLCFYGFVGLGIDLMRGNRLIYGGWYWYIYPWISAFWVAILILIGIAAIMGISMPSSTVNRSRRYDRDQIYDNLMDMAVEDFLKEFEKEIDKLKKMGELTQQEAKVVQRLEDFDDDFDLEKELQDALEADEREALFSLFIKILRMLGIEVI